MNNYIALRKANRMRTKLLTEESQAQLKEVIRYLRRVSWTSVASNLCAAICLILQSKPTRKIRNCFIRFRTQRPLWKRSSQA